MTKLAAGTKVEIGDAGTDDYDVGVVHRVIDADDFVYGKHYAGCVLVGWESGVTAPADQADLRVHVI